MSLEGKLLLKQFSSVLWHFKIIRLRYTFYCKQHQCLHGYQGGGIDEYLSL
jgi:hypothetical protein